MDTAKIEKKKPGRKFAVVIISAVLLGLGMIAGIFGAYNNLDLPWLSVTLPILAAVLPSYIAGNAYQKGKESDK